MNDTAQRGVDARSQPRSSMFLTALLRVGAEQAAVKVRNMSPNGALVESGLTAPPGSRVQLIRGMLQAHGTVMWASNNRCGLRFSSEILVKDWLAAPAKAEQQRVDEIVSLIKAGAILPKVADSGGLNASHARRSEEQLADDLEAVVSLMQDLEDDLASSPETLARHGMKLQNLDIAMQMVRAIAQQMTCSGSGQSPSVASLDDLRIVCAQALGTG